MDEREELHDDLVLSNAAPAAAVASSTTPAPAPAPAPALGASSLALNSTAARASGPQAASASAAPAPLIGHTTLSDVDPALRRSVAPDEDDLDISTAPPARAPALGSRTLQALDDLHAFLHDKDSDALLPDGHVDLDLSAGLATPPMDEQYAEFLVHLFDTEAAADDDLSTLDLSSSDAVAAAPGLELDLDTRVLETDARAFGPQAPAHTTLSASSSDAVVPALGSSNLAPNMLGSTARALGPQAASASAARVISTAATAPAVGHRSGVALAHDLDARVISTAATSSRRPYATALGLLALATRAAPAPPAPHSVTLDGVGPSTAVTVQAAPFGEPVSDAITIETAWGAITLPCMCPVEVSSIKEKVRTLWNVPVEVQTIFHKGDEVNDRVIFPGSRLYLFTMVNVVVHAPNGLLTMYIDAYDTVAGAKNTLEHISHGELPAATTMLRFHGVEMDDGNRLVDYNLPGPAIHVTAMAKDETTFVERAAASASQHLIVVKLVMPGGEPTPLQVRLVDTVDAMRPRIAMMAELPESYGFSHRGRFMGGDDMIFVYGVRDGDRIDIIPNN